MLKGLDPHEFRDLDSSLMPPKIDLSGMKNTDTYQNPSIVSLDEEYEDEEDEFDDDD
jgi:hypothetical protein